MKRDGKVLFFNATEGNGIIITSQKEKLQFNVMEWNDFETMPALGLEVVFDYIDELPKNISVKTEDETEFEENESKTTEVETIQENNSELTQQDIQTPELQQNTDAVESPSVAETPDNESPKSIQEQQNNELETVQDTSAENNEEEKSEILPSEEALHTEVDPQHFEGDEGIELLMEVDEEFGPREESVTLTLNIKIAVENYFNIINDHLLNRQGFRKVNGKLNYLLIRRFLWTVYNNLSEIDIHIITPQIKMLSDDLKLSTRLYDDFMRKTRFPALAYQEVFLACQDEYMKITKGAQDMMEKLSRLRSSEEQVGSILKVKKEELSQNIQTAEFDLLQDELKSLNGAYVDIVHMMAELDERYKHDMELLQTFEQEYREDFNALFTEAAKEHHVGLVDLLNSQAFLLDNKLWEEAKNSKAVKAHFQNSTIQGELNTKTYLKYYLDSMDDSRVSEENKKLVELYNYLVSLHKDHIMILVGSAQDAMTYESEMKKLGPSYEAKAFIDEKAALKWAIKHTVKVLVIEDELSRLNAEIFLQYYKKYILVTPKIILLGMKPSNNNYPISKLLGKNIAPKVLLQNVKELFENKKNS